MITINDDDLPITVAEKLISGTKHYEQTAMTKAFVKAWTGKESSEEIDMFDIDELKEIADYLMVYYETHKCND